MVGDKIRDLRKRIGITQEQLAGPELTKSYVSQVELGRIRPSRRALEIIAKRLGKPLGYFMDNDDDLRTVSVLLQASEALVVSRRLEEALVGLNEAQYLAERIGRDDILAQIEATIGRVDLAQAQYATAITHFKKALASLSPDTDAEQVARIAADLGLTSQHAGLFHEAVSHFHYSVQTARRQANPALTADVLTQYGDFCFREKQWRSALTLYQEAQRLSTASRTTPGLTVRIAVVQCRLGDLQAAQVTVTGALRDWEALSHGDARDLLGRDLAQCLIALKNFDDSRRLIDDSIASVAYSRTAAEAAMPEILETALLWCQESPWDPRAVNHYLELIANQPETPAFHAVKAHAYAFQAERCASASQALTYFDSALRYLPGDRQIALKRACVAIQVHEPGAVDQLWSLVFRPRPDGLTPLSFAK